MNFVIFGRSFLPVNGPEAFCTSRFANALAESGHTVKVVTMDWPQEVEKSACEELLTSKMEITRVAIKKCPNPPYWSRLRYLTNEWMAVDIPNCVRTLRDVLKNTEDPVLISRGNPETSNIVGYCCRKYARKWVVHFSDPFPWFSTRLNECLGRWWGRRMLNAADYCSVTCPEVLRFFSETYGRVFERNKHKFIVTPHIGDPLLSGANTFHKRADNVFLVSHCGSMSNARGMRVLIDEIPGVINQKKTQFLQCGHMLASEIPTNVKDVEIRELKSTREVTDIFVNSDANIVTDLRTRLPYIPFLPSKFVYLLFTEKPIIAYTMKGSCMHRLSCEYPEAGIIFADMDERGSVRKACESAMRMGKCLQRDRVRTQFTKTSVATGFVNKVSA